jgi:hypothetical protein
VNAYRSHDLKRGQSARTWIWHRLVFLADRISPADAFRCTCLRFEYVEQIGIRVLGADAHEAERLTVGRGGCPLWYKGADYGRADGEIR